MLYHHQFRAEYDINLKLCFVTFTILAILLRLEYLQEWLNVPIP